jgi:hypothetical protein
LRNVFDYEFEKIGLLARFFKGGLTIPYMMELKFRRDIKPWYDIYILQSTEEEVITDLSYDDKGRKRTLPPPWKIREIVLEKIENDKNKFEEYLNQEE